MIKSKKIGTIVNGFLILDSRRVETKNGKSKTGRYKVQCIKCGKISEKAHSGIINGLSACECSKMKRKSGKIGKSINGFKIIDSKRERENGEKVNYTLYVVECENCGRIFEIGADSVLKGKASCLCSRKIRFRNSNGHLHTRIYNIYDAMIQRTENPKSDSYGNYGGRGIKVCEEWQKDFMSFYNWSMENGYSDELTIDRIDVNGNYEPSNCRWSTRKEQQNNRRNNVYLTYNDETKTMKQWSEEKKIPYKVLQTRIRKGWDTEKALTTPVKKAGVKIV